MYKCLILLDMPVAKGNKSVMVTMPKTTYKKLKKIAVDKEITLSNLLITACEISPFITNGSLKLIDSDTIKK